MPRILFLLIFSICFSLNSFSQEESRSNIGIELRQKTGFLLPHRSIMKHLVQGHSLGGEISLIYQTNGTEEWHQSFNNPRYGFSAYFSDFGFKEVLGVAYGAYMFGELPFIKQNGWNFSGKKGAGLAYVTEIFDQHENPKNNSISTHLNILLVLGLNVSKQFNQSELSLSLDMTHISNGGAKMPNLGLNVPYLSLGYTHFLKPLKFSDNNSSDFSKYLISDHWSMNVAGVGSAKQVYPTGGDNYLAVGLGFYAQKRFKRKVAAEFGLDFMLNQSHTRFAPPSATQMDVLQVGLYTAYVLPVNRFSFVLGIGGYLKNNLGTDGFIYNRFGARYSLSDHWVVNMTIKSHWGRADYFEYGLIYKVF